MPLVNLYLKSYINAFLPEVQVVPGDDNYNVDELGEVDRFDAVGISVMTPQRHEALSLARAIKHVKETTVILGGPHVRHYHSDLLREPCVDYLVSFDGERALTTVLSGRGSTKVVADVLSREEVLAQPRPDRTSDNARSVVMNYHYMLNRMSAATMMTARGCPE